MAKAVVEGAGFAQEWEEAKVANNWKRAVRELCEKRLKGDLRSDVGSHSSLELFTRVGRFSGVDPWLRLELRHPGRALKVRLRAGALPLMVHVGVANLIKERRMRRCAVQLWRRGDRGAFRGTLPVLRRAESAMPQSPARPV